MMWVQANEPKTVLPESLLPTLASTMGQTPTEGWAVPTLGLIAVFVHNLARFQ